MHQFFLYLVTPVQDTDALLTALFVTALLVLAWLETAMLVPSKTKKPVPAWKYPKHEFLGAGIHPTEWPSIAALRSRIHPIAEMEEVLETWAIKTRS